MNRLPVLRATTGMAALGAAALACAAVLAGVVTPRWADEAAGADSQRQTLLDTARARKAAARPQPLAERPPPSAPLPATSARVGALLTAAARQGLQVAAVQQRWAGSDSGALQVTLPLEGRYVDVRRFIEVALRADARLALDGLRLEREGPDAPTVRADLQWTLHAADPGTSSPLQAAASPAHRRPVPPYP